MSVTAKGTYQVEYSQDFETVDEAIEALRGLRERHPVGSYYIAEEDFTLSLYGITQEVPA